MTCWEFLPQAVTGSLLQKYGIVLRFCLAQESCFVFSAFGSGDTIGVLSVSGMRASGEWTKAVDNVASQGDGRSSHVSAALLTCHLEVVTSRFWPALLHGDRLLVKAASLLCKTLRQPACRVPFQGNWLERLQDCRDAETPQFFKV